MSIFGKSISEYFAFQKLIMILILIVGFGRLGLSLAGLPISTVRWLSLTALSIVGVIYCAVKVPRTGFGTYKHLLPLFVAQAGIANLIIAGGIALAAVSGTPNIYSSPEFSGPMVERPWMHAGAHLVMGIIIGPLLAWLIGSALMFVVKRVSGAQPAQVSAGN